MLEAIRPLALGAAPAVPSNLKVIGQDRVTLGHDIGVEGNGRRCRTGLVRRGVPAYGWGEAEKGVNRPRVNGWCRL